MASTEEAAPAPPAASPGEEAAPATPAEPGAGEGEEKVDGDGEEEPAEVLPPACIDLQEFKLKVDHFEGVHAMPDEVEKVEGAPNFRQVNGYPVFGAAQPTDEGFRKVLDKMEKGTEAKPLKTIWFNMRQEPVVYVNGLPNTLRDPERMHENLALDQPVEELDNLEKHARNLVRSRVEADPDKMVMISRDAAFTENPMERENVEENLRADSVAALQDIYSDLTSSLPSLSCVRVPVVEESAPKEECIDIIVQSLKEEKGSTNCIFSCQAGRGRTTLGMVVACMVKEIQVTAELRRMESLGLVPAATVKDLLHSKFESTLPDTQYADDPMVNGEFEVIKELLEKLPGAREAKTKVDRTIDLCGGPPRGTGLQNLRECIIETKWKYDVAPEDKQKEWKQMILNFMQRYFYLICFATYALEVGPGGFQTTFAQFMDGHSELRAMIEEGKDKLEWTRQVDPAKLNTLKELIAGPDYKDNMQKIIRTIYEFAFMTYADLPRGPIKNNSMRKLAAKTLMEILPPEIEQMVQKKLDERNSSADFLSIVGLITYDKPAESAAA